MLVGCQTNQPNNQTNEATNQSLKSINQSTKQHINRPIRDQEARRSTGGEGRDDAKSIRSREGRECAVGCQTNQPTNQAIEQSLQINQPINESTNQSIYQGPRVAAQHGGRGP